MTTAKADDNEYMGTKAFDRRTHRDPDFLDDGKALTFDGFICDIYYFLEGKVFFLSTTRPEIGMVSMGPKIAIISKDLFLKFSSSANATDEREKVREKKPLLW